MLILSKINYSKLIFVTFSQLRLLLWTFIFQFETYFKTWLWRGDSEITVEMGLVATLAASAGASEVIFLRPSTLLSLVDS